MSQPGGTSIATPACDCVWLCACDCVCDCVFVVVVVVACLWLCLWLCVCGCVCGCAPWSRSGREHWAWKVVVEVRQGTLGADGHG